jgi:hypothetical protein
MQATQECCVWLGASGRGVVDGLRGGACWRRLGRGELCGPGFTDGPYIRNVGKRPNCTRYCCFMCGLSLSVSTWLFLSPISMKERLLYL